MIFVAAGTQDGRELAGFLLEHGYRVTASVVSRYGEQLLERYRGIAVNDKPLDAEGLKDFLKEHGARILVDASHPYAANVSRNSMEACHGLGIPYLRYEREGTPVTYSKVFRVTSYEEAAKKAAELGKNVFFTTGSRNLRIFKESPYFGGLSPGIPRAPQPGRDFRDDGHGLPAQGHRRLAGPLFPGTQ